MTAAFCGMCECGELLPMGLNDLSKYESTGYLKAGEGSVYRYVSR